MRQTPTLAASRQHRWCLWLCVVSLLGFQALGLVHRAVHGGPAPEPVRLALAAAQSVAAMERATAVASSDDLFQFNHVAGSADCQLLDQLSHALGPIVQAFAWTAALPDHPVSTAQPHNALLAQLWRKSARGPPLA